jgi:hypothetical protein
MKVDRIAKAYEGLNNKELANLAFHYITNTNQVEMGRIADAVPRKTYKCKDAEFVRWYESFFDMAAFWSIEHWKAYGRMMEARVEFLIMLKNKIYDEAQLLLEVFRRMESRLLAVDAAMLTVCEEHGIDADGVQRLAGGYVFTATSADMIPDADCQAEMHANFGLLLTSKC